MITPTDPKTQSLPYPLRSLLIAQFCGAFNDNAWKLMVALLAIRQATAGMAPGPGLETVAQTQTAMAFVIFTLPLMLLSLVGGTLADRVSKRTVIISIKVVEVFLMAAGTIALWMNPTGGVLPLVVLCGMGIHSALFSPSKYGILPELVPHERLAAGNGLLELWTFAAILTGTAAGGALLQMAGNQTWLAPLALTGLAVIGLITAFGVPQVSPARTAGGVGTTVRWAWATIRSERMLRMAIPMEVLFWTVASLFGQNLLVYAKAILQLSDAASGLPLTVLSVGIGVGSILVGRISTNRVEYGLIPIGATGVFLALLLLGLLTPPLSGTFLLMVILGISSSFIFVPLNAVLQWKSPPDRRGAVISFSNTCVFTGILLGSLVGGSLATAGLSTTGIFIAAAVITLLGIGWAVWLLPETLLRCVLVVLSHTVFRLRIIDQIHVPQSGGALLVPNHVSLIDGLLLIASLDRPVRFVVDSRYAEQSIVKPFMKALRIIPLSAHGDVRSILRALRDAGAAIDQGELVCVFPEGQITGTGTQIPFRRGFERIMKGRTAPIIPVHLDRVWGSIFSFNHGCFRWKVPERLPYPLTVSFGTPLPPDTTLHELHGNIRELGEAAWRLRISYRQPLHREFIRAMRRYPFRLAMADQNRPRVTSLQALIGSIVLAKTLQPHWDGQERVGVLLPPTVAGALVNVAAPLCGKTIVNLNYTVGKPGLEAAVALAGLRTIVTSRTFIEKAKLDLPDGPSVIWLEDAAKTISTGRKIMAALLALFAPCHVIERACGQTTPLTPGSLATIIFSSGSTGEPKGVMLSHFSVDANIQGATQMLHLYQDERVLGILPFFHSFGYMVFWLVMFNNAAMIFHPSPLDATVIGELIQKHRVTFLVTTPTFLQLYSRRCTPKQLDSVRVILTGAEKLSTRLATTIADTFGIAPIEGYGVTECAPVIAVNCPDFSAAGYYQPASRRGTVGQPLPGISVQVVDPDSYAPLSACTPGMLLVKGPNVMNGYLQREDLTAQIMRNGWYVTGDIASLDDDGFVTITDRLSRFSKIGGEMVPHGTVEDALQQAAEADTQVFAVTGLPDEKKGERLAVLHTLEESRIPHIVEKVSASGLPNLFIPGKHQFVKVDALPVLGTGKLDLRGVKRIAAERLASHNA